MDDNRKEQLEKQIQSAWDFTFGKLYYPPTKNFYDFLVDGKSIGETLETYPTAEEIQGSSPNPCGWNTNMENSTLNACSVIEGIIARYELTGDPEMKKYFDMVCEGLILNGTISSEPGFIARCISPVDGESFYMDSSRDQYTNWVYAAHLILHTELADEEQKAAVREVLVNIARKAERDVKPETGGYLMRLDGKPGIVSQVDSEKLGPHEILRLPMFYMAAYEASNDVHWLEKYREIRDRFLDRAEEEFTLEFVKRVAHGFGLVFGSYQSQYSVRLLYDLEEDDTYSDRYYKLLQVAAEGATEYMGIAYDNIEACCVDEPLFKPWRSIPAAEYRFFQGRSYYCPMIFEGRVMQRYPRNVAEVIIIQCLCPGYEIPEWEKEMFYKFVERLPFAKAQSYWPLLFCDAWWLAKKSGHI